MTNDIGAVRKRQQLKAIVAFQFGFRKEQTKSFVDKTTAGYLFAKETYQVLYKYKVLYYTVKNCGQELQEMN